MISAFVIYANIVFWPSSMLGGEPMADRILPIKASYETQDQCAAALREKIQAHIDRTGVKSVRKELTTGDLCVPRMLAAHYTEADDAAYAQMIRGAVSGQAQGRGVLNEFVK
jgi:hypothetical protein